MKTIMMAAVAAFAISAFGSRSPEELFSKGYELKKSNNNTELVKLSESLTKDEMKAILDYVCSIAQTNAASASFRTVSPFFIPNWLIHRCPEFAEEFDLAMSKVKGYEVNPLKCYESMPRASESTLSEFEKYQNWYPVSVSLVRKYKTHRLGGVMTLPEWLNVFAETAVRGLSGWYRGSREKARMVEAATKYVKRRIREMGGTFVVGPDGKNHVQDAVDSLASVLNAPKMSGIKEWLAKWAPDYKWVDVGWMSDAEVAKLKDDVFYGEKPFNAINKEILEIHLGVDAYNEFVKAYNGTAK